MKPPYVLRMEEEQRELGIKLEALAYWVSNSEEFSRLDPAEKEDQRNQLFHMRGYKAALDSRMKRWQEQHATPRLQK